MWCTNTKRIHIPMQLIYLAASSVRQTQDWNTPAKKCYAIRSAERGTQWAWVHAKFPPFFQWEAAAKKVVFFSCKRSRHKLKGGSSEGISFLPSCTCQTAAAGGFFFFFVLHVLTSIYTFDWPRGIICPSVSLPISLAVLTWPRYKGQSRPFLPYPRSFCCLSWSTTNCRLDTASTLFTTIGSTLFTTIGSTLFTTIGAWLKVCAGGYFFCGSSSKCKSRCTICRYWTLFDVDW